MSARSRPVDLSPEARDDYTSILLYTAQQWGDQQMEVYSDLLERALLRIGSNPGIGRRRDDLRPGIRVVQVRQHVIYYRTVGEVIRVDRILHAKMNAVDLLQEP
jgi:toxin ParE1/3/4